MTDVAPGSDLPPIYHGEDLHSIDAKGRVNVPARHRRVASRKGAVGFWFTPGFDGCVFLWDDQGFMDYSDRIARLEPDDVNKARLLRRKIFRLATRVEPDVQGRVVVPENLRRDAGLDAPGQVSIIGVQNHLELWQPRAYAQYETGSSESLGDIAGKLVF